MLRILTGLPGEETRGHDGIYLFTTHMSFYVVRSITVHSKDPGGYVNLLSSVNITNNFYVSKSTRTACDMKEDIMTTL